MKKIFTLLFSIGITACVSMATAQVANHVTISQIYGGGGNAGAVYTNDFIELYNPTAAPVNIGNWQVAYASSSGTSWVNKTKIPDGTIIQPYQYYLIQQAAGATPVLPLPTPDLTGSIAMAAANGKVALINDTTTLAANATPTPVANPVTNVTGSVIDYVGYGTANTYEGSGPAPAPSNSLAIRRLGVGGIDTNDNASDFVTSAPAPRNSSVFPLTLLSFGATLADNKVNITWSTANEVNFGNFEVERSINGKDFIAVSKRLESKGAATNNYSFVDETPVAGVSYYRLKMNDKDGSFKYSPIEVIKTKTIGVNVYPNPVRSTITVQHEVAAKGAVIIVMDMSGKQATSLAVQAGAVQTTINAAQLAPGSYMIVYTNNGVRQTKQFIKE